MAEGLPQQPLVYVELSRGHAKTSTVAEVAMVEALRGDGADFERRAGYLTTTAE